jgi:hypothetical protein
MIKTIKSFKGNLSQNFFKIVECDNSRVLKSPKKDHLNFYSADHLIADEYSIKK